MMMRILSLPARFFKDYGSGDLASRATMLGSFCELVFHNLFSVGMTSLASLAYLSVIFDLTPSLAVPALVFLCIKAAVFMATAYVQMGIKHREKRCSTRENGVAYALLSGITKIRLAGAEKRAFVKWANAYGELGAAKYNPSWFIQVNNAILLAVSLAASGVYMTIAVRSGISASHFLAFMAADGVLSGAFASLSSVGDALAELAPIMEMIRPILQTAPEASENRELVGRLSGRIELSNVSFCYRERSGFHINELNLKIDPGEYVAIVGRSGSGKSTLIRLLLGFEAPQMGAIYYDGKDINNLELRSLRRHIGVVTQDGGLFEGSIFENIAISNPDMGLEEAWEAAELAGIADDIRQMPMGMNTVLSEGRGGISGGHKQRIMIARAVASRPKILMFDEATSALDNLTQKMVADALDHLNCTRIVIAHRLSTIRHCDRILVMEEGHLIEEGSYEELIAADGVFAGLIARQQLGGRDAQVGKMMLY